MFRPQFVPPAALALVLAFAPVALAQSTATNVNPSAASSAAPAAAASVTLGSSVTFTPGPKAPADAILAALSAQAGIPYTPKPKATGALPIPPVAAIDDAAGSRLCLRAGLGLSVPVISGPPMTLEHGLIGCPTDTGGLPVVVVQDPALQAPPTSRTGDYNLDLTLRYRVLHMKHIDVVASASEQGVGYSLGGPVSGNNLLLAVSLNF